VLEVATEGSVDALTTTVVVVDGGSDADATREQCDGDAGDDRDLGRAQVLQSVPHRVKHRREG
jgi:hypothetical protein